MFNQLQQERKFIKDPKKRNKEENLLNLLCNFENIEASYLTELEELYLIGIFAEMKSKVISKIEELRN